MSEIKVASFPTLSLQIFCAFLHLVQGNNVKYLYTVQSQFAHSEARFFQTVRIFLQHTYKTMQTPTLLVILIDGISIILGVEFSHVKFVSWVWEGSKKTRYT